MKCLECRERGMTTKPETFQYNCGIPVLLVGVQVSRCPNCGNFEVAIPNMEGLHEKIADVVILRPSRLTGAEVRFLRTFLGWSGRDFARKLGVRPETVSKWENGKRPMSRSNESLLRLWAATGLKTVDYAQPNEVRDRIDQERFAAVVSMSQTPIECDEPPPPIRVGPSETGWMDAALQQPTC